MNARRLIPILTAAVLLAPAAFCDVPGAPKPIPVPPIPKAPQLGPPPKVTLPTNRAPGKPDIEIPAALTLDRLPIPPEAPITPADKADPVPAPLSGTKTAAPAKFSPGGNPSQIEEMLFAVEPGASQFSQSASDKLKAIAGELVQDPAARLEVRTFTPAKPHAESAAHRLSLARFLAIRDFLTRNGVDDAKIDGRPLVSTPDELNGDRVEIYIEH